MAFMADVDFRPDVYQIKQLNNVLVAHPDASMTSWCLISCYWSRIPVARVIFAGRFRLLPWLMVSIWQSRAQPVRLALN